MRVIRAGVAQTRIRPIALPISVIGSETEDTQTMLQMYGLMHVYGHMRRFVWTSKRWNENDSY